MELRRLQSLASSDASNRISVLIAPRSLVRGSFVADFQQIECGSTFRRTIAIPTAGSGAPISSWRVDLRITRVNCGAPPRRPPMRSAEDRKKVDEIWNL